MTAGALCAALGFWLTSRADSLGELYWSYALIGGIGIGFSTILPAQTLAVNWFVRYRARATAIILVGGSAVGALVTPIDELVLRHWSWREGWLLIAGCSLVVAVIAALFLRNKPEDLGLAPDGREPRHLGQPRRARRQRRRSSVGPPVGDPHAALPGRHLRRARQSTAVGDRDRARPHSPRGPRLHLGRRGGDPRRCGSASRPRAG